MNEIRNDGRKPGAIHHEIELLHKSVGDLAARMESLITIIQPSLMPEDPPPAEKSECLEPCQSALADQVLTARKKIEKIAENIEVVTGRCQL